MGEGSISGFGHITGGSRYLSREELKVIKEYADKQLAYLTMQGAIWQAKQQAASQTSSKTNSFSEITDAMGLLNKTLGSIVKTDTPSNTNGNSSVNKNTTQNQASGAGGGGSVSDNGASYSGLANTSNISNNAGTFDMSKINSMSASIDSNPNLSINDLNTMKNQLSSSKVDVSTQLASAQADFSNIQSQMQTAEANVTRLEGAVDNAETARDDAKTNLDNNKSNLNSSVKARDNLDEQLSSVNEQYKSDCEAVKTQEQNKAAAQGEVSTAKTAKAQAEAGVASAAQALSSAEATLASTPKVNADGTPNPQYEIAKAAVEQAKTQKEQADKALEEANNSLEAAESKLETAEQDLSTAQEAKHATLENLQQTDSQYKDMAKKCEQMQDTVEKNQEVYDTSLETFDDTSANYERLNEELQSQQGIINQLGVYETKLQNMQEASDKIKELDAKIDEKLKAKDAITDEMLKNAQASSGFSAGKTPAENILSSENGPTKMSDWAYTGKYAGGGWVDDSQMKALQGREVINEDASFFEKSGCVANSDGSYTNPEQGWTWVNLKDNTWVRTDALDKSAEYMDLAREKYPEAVEAFERSREQAPDYGVQGWLPNDNLNKWKNIRRSSI